MSLVCSLFDGLWNVARQRPDLTVLHPHTGVLTRRCGFETVAGRDSSATLHWRLCD
jgi:hypothetical protein